MIRANSQMASQVRFGERISYTNDSDKKAKLEELNVPHKVLLEDKVILTGPELNEYVQTAAAKTKVEIAIGQFEQGVKKATSEAKQKKAAAKFLTFLAKHK